MNYRWKPVTVMVFVLMLMLVGLTGAAQGATSVFINEIHYDNTSTDTGEAIEIAGPAGTDLAGWSIVLYNGNGGAVYNTRVLTGVIPDQQNGHGTLFFTYPTDGLQNGSPDGIALVDPASTVVQFLSYEGVFAAVDGPAAGLTSADIGVQEPNTTPVGFSLQLTGTGTAYEDFTWATPSASTFGLVNTGQTFGEAEPPTETPPPPPAASVIINELDSDTPGTDALEFVELYDGGVGSTALDGLVVVFYNGSNDLSYAAFDLDGFSTDAGGYFVLGNAAVSPAPSLIFPGNFLQNGADAVAVYAGNAADFPNNTPVTTANLVDAVVYDTDDADDPGLLVLLNAGQPQVNENGGGDGANHSSQRCPNGSGGARNTNTFLQGAPSPAASSNCAPPPPPATAATIMQIQGVGHRSPLVGQNVVTTGIVTAVSSNGFYLQDPVGDGDIATSDALFVFTSSAPAVVAGDSLSVIGAVAEFYPGGFGSGNLSTTEITGPSITVLSSGNTVPFPTIIGIGGRVPPTTVIDDDATGDVETTGTFDPATDGIDFYESLEGMRAQVNNAVAVGPTNNFGEIAVVGDNGINAGTRTPRGGIVIQPGDFNPERIILDDALQPTPDVNVNDRFAIVVGVLDYSFGNFKLLVTETPTPVSGGLTREMAAPAAAGQLSIATFNVENLDPGDGSAKFAALASQIVSNLGAPDIIGLEEVQDNNGATNDAVVDASQTYTMLIAAIQAAGGPVYEFRDIPPVDDQDGGEPGGNIRVGFLFRPDRVTFVDRPGGGSTTATTVIQGPDGVQLSASPGRIDPTNSAFDDSRKPLVGEFIFNGETVFAIINHFNSKGGDNPLFGRVQPPVLSSEVQRIQQAQLVNDFVDSILSLDPDARVVVFGDLNDFPFSTPLSVVAGDDLTNLVTTLPIQEQYTFIFDGNSQVLDNFLVSDALVAETDEFDIVHTNAEFAVQDSDHDPSLGRFGIARTVLVDIRPLSDDNIINLRSRLLLPVAIYSTPDFDATTINPQTVTLAGAPVARLFGSGPLLAVRVDVNRDGLRDWLLSFETRDLQLTPSSTEAVLEGQTFGGFQVRGSDSVRILPTTAPDGLVANYPTFTWNAVEGAVCYQIQIANTPAFILPRQDATVDGTTYNASPLLPGQYYWRVRVGGTCVNVLSGPWSSAQRFTVP